MTKDPRVIGRAVLVGWVELSEVLRAEYRRRCRHALATRTTCLRNSGGGYLVGQLLGIHFDTVDRTPLVSDGASRLS